MKKIIVPVSGFDLRGFFNNFMQFGIEQFSDPYSSIYIVSSPEDQPVCIGDGHRDLYREMDNDNKMLFFSFSAPAFENFVQCLDGEVYSAVPPTGDRLEDLRNIFYPTDLQFPGYLISLGLRRKNIVIQSALFYAGTQHNEPWLEIIGHCGLLERPMINYIERFMI